MIIKIISEWDYLHKKNMEILDIGCRDGTLTKIIFEQLDISYSITGIDIDTNALLRYRDNFPGAAIKIIDCNENLPFKNKYFDLIIAGEIIEHLINPKLFLEEINRILKPSGLFIGSTPNAFRWDKRLQLLFGNDPKYFSDPTHLQYFSYNSIKSILNQQFSSAYVFSYPKNILVEFLPELFSSGFIWQIKK